MHFPFQSGKTFLLFDDNRDSCIDFTMLLLDTYPTIDKVNMYGYSFPIDHKKSYNVHDEVKYDPNTIEILLNDIVSMHHSYKSNELKKRCHIFKMHPNNINNSQFIDLISMSNVFNITNIIFMDNINKIRPSLKYNISYILVNKKMSHLINDIAKNDLFSYEYPYSSYNTDMKFVQQGGYLAHIYLDGVDSVLPYTSMGYGNINETYNDDDKMTVCI